MSERNRGRKDHYLPQGYLRGFINPARRDLDKPLWWFQVPQRRWRECSSSEVGFIRGFYDFSMGKDPDKETADEAFADLERNFTLVLRDLRASQFSNWLNHHDFLLRYMQMIRVRSPLYFQQKYVEGKKSPAALIEEISEDRRRLKIRPIELPDSFIKNTSLKAMMGELKSGVDWLNNFDWALRHCDSLSNSFLTSDSPFVVTGPLPGQEDLVKWEALYHPDTLLYFPLCWEACIVGTPIQRPFDIKTDRAMPKFLQRVREMYRKNAKSYLISAVKLDD
jgi:hypothetical protein